MAECTLPPRGWFCTRLAYHEEPCQIVPGFDEDEIADAIGDSLDMDWTPRDGARAVMKMIRDKGLAHEDTSSQRAI